jgi:outer membrane receptor protein involved in Fe transport
MVAAQTRSEYFMTPFNGDGHDPITGAVNTRLTDMQPAYTRLDAGIGYTRLDGKVRLQAFGQNLNNTVYLASFNQTPNLNLRFFNPPRQYGVRLQLFW